MKNQNYRHLCMGLAAGTALASMVACGKKSNSDDAPASAPPQGSPVTITGTINLQATAALEGSASATAIDGQKVNCTIFKDPPEFVSAALDANGKFSLDSAGSGYPMGCIVVDKAGVQISSFVFKNTKKKDLSGQPSLDARIAFNGASDLGSITADADTGAAVIDTANISNIAVASLGATTDFSGSWVIAKADVVPDGYSSPCPEGQHLGGDNNCNGPSLGEKLWIKRLNGKTVADGQPSFGVQVWQSEESFKACGSTLGFTYADAKTNAGIDLTDSGVAEGAFKWSADWADGWQNTANATSGDFDMVDCSPLKYQDKFDAYKCSAEDGRYTVNIQGGCLDGDKKPVQVDNWSNLTDAKYTNEADTATGLQKNTTKGTYNGKSVSCENIFGSFNKDGSKVTDNAMIQPRILAAKGSKCSTIPDDHKLQKFQCFANYYYQKGRDNSNACLRRIQTDWTATNADKFLTKDGTDQANGQDVLALLNYSDEKTAALHDEHTDYRGIQVNGNWVNCKVREAFTMTIHAISDVKLSGEFVSETKNVDVNKPACVAGISGGVSKTFLYFVKP